MKKTTLTLAIMILLPCLSSAMAEPPKLATVLDDENGLGAEFWMYNDIQAAMKEARLQNKPLFVTFRCVPCEDCLAFDAEVAKGSNVIRELAVKHFIPVRQVEMKGVDLSLFQFDHDLNWAAMFINADGVIYARYGTQSAAGADAYNSIEGLRQTMLRVLQLHRGYPGNMAELRGKRGPTSPRERSLLNILSLMPKMFPMALSRSLVDKRQGIFRGGGTPRKSSLHTKQHPMRFSGCAKACLSVLVWKSSFPHLVAFLLKKLPGVETMLFQTRTLKQAFRIGCCLVWNDNSRGGTPVRKLTWHRRTSRTQKLPGVKHIKM